MGNTQVPSKDEFEAENFTRNDLSLEEVHAIRAAWNYFQPINGQLDKSNLKDSYGISQKALLTLMRQGQNTVSWEEFLEVMHEQLLAQQGEVQCEAVQKNVACFLCGPIYTK